MGGILRGVGKHREDGGDTWQQGDPPGNAMNPTIGSGMQQARDSQRSHPKGWSRGSPGDGANGGANRRGGEKPRGRNMVLVWSIRVRRGGGDIGSGVDAREHVDGGAERHGRAGAGQRCPSGDSDRTNPRRGGRFTDRGDSHAALKGSEDHEGRDSKPHREMWERGRRCSRKPSRVTGRPERPRRARGRTTDPLRRQRWRNQEHRKKRLYAAALKIPPTP